MRLTKVNRSPDLPTGHPVSSCPYVILRVTLGVYELCTANSCGGFTIPGGVGTTWAVTAAMRKAHEARIWLLVMLAAGGGFFIIVLLITLLVKA